MVRHPAAAALAELAVTAAAGIDATAQPAFLMLGLIVQSYLLLAEARYRAGQIEEAEEALAVAEANLAEGCREPRTCYFRLLRHLRRIQASFDGAQERFASIVTLLETRLEEEFDV